MIAMAVSFPNSFLSSLVFIFYGNTGEELIANFQETQDLGQHIASVREYIAWETQQENYDFTEDVYTAATSGASISTDDVKRFFSLCPEVCEVLDFVEGDNALQILRDKYPQALCR